MNEPVYKTGPHALMETMSKPSVFAPNGIETVEDCPVCGEPGMTVRHGRKCVKRGDEYPKTEWYQHFESCKVCGDSTPVVLYDCEDCARE